MTVTERAGKNDLCSLAAALPAVTARLWVKKPSWQTQGGGGEVVAGVGGLESGVFEQPAMVFKLVCEYPDLAWLFCSGSLSTRC